LGRRYPSPAPTIREEENGEVLPGCTRSRPKTMAPYSKLLAYSRTTTTTIYSPVRPSLSKPNGSAAGGTRGQRQAHRSDSQRWNYRRVRGGKGESGSASNGIGIIINKQRPYYSTRSDTNRPQHKWKKKKLAIRMTHVHGS
jgi:hypothetical protein